MTTTPVLKTHEQRALIRALYTATECTRLPTIPEFIVSEVVNGALSFTGNNPTPITYAQGWMNDNIFLLDIHKQFQTIDGRKVSRNIRELLDDMLKPERQRCSPERPRESCHLQELWGGKMSGFGLCQVIGHSTFDVPHNFIVEGKKYIDSLDERTQREITGIGIAMRLFIEEDLKYIRETYHW